MAPKRNLAGRAAGYGLMAAAFLATLALNLFTLVQIARGSTCVPKWDDWAVVQDLAQIDRGHAAWPILWAPYWGERLVAIRLLFLADARWLSLGPLAWLTVLLQLVHIGVLMTLAWLLLGRAHRLPEGAARTTLLAPFLVAATVILNLLLSPFQMENFLWSIQAVFPLTFLAASGAFFCLSLAGGRNRVVFAGLAIALAALSSLGMPNGLLVWPVLVLQALYLKRSRWVVVALAFAGAIFVATYLWHYPAPDAGMGVAGMLRHPFQAALLLGLVVAGPVGYVSNGVAAITGALVLVVTGFVVAGALRLRVPERPWLTVVAAEILFLVLSSLSIVPGRLDPRYLGRDPLYTIPIRYPNMIGVLWACIAVLVIYTCWQRRVRPGLLGFYAAPFFYLMFATAGRQIALAEDWADFFRGADALGTAFLLDVPDDHLLARLWPVRTEREERVAFLRENKLAMFHEPRAAWMGKSIAELFSVRESDRCDGGIEKMTDVGGFSRVQGWAWDNRRGDSPDYILLAGANGRIVGLGRGGLRHGYIPGLLVEPGPVPLSHARFRHSDWLGYARDPASASVGQMTLYGVFSGQRSACRIE